jgi:hypothetical protein
VIEDKTPMKSAPHNPDDMHIVTTSSDTTAQIRDKRILSMSPTELLSKICDRNLLGRPKLTRAEMDLIGEPAGVPEIDACARQLNN